MAYRLKSAALTAATFLLTPSLAQLSDPSSVGCTTSTESKASKVCNILDYGGSAGADGDIGSAIAEAWADCASGGQVYIPEGEYGLSTWVNVKDGTGVSINIEGTIYRTG